VTISYSEVLARNVRAARARLGLEQEPLAARMRALGFESWRRQTVANVEKNTRRVTAEEVFGLALALETRLMGLMEPVTSDDPISLPSGASMAFMAVHEMLWGASQYAIAWDGDTPRFLEYNPPRDRPFHEWLPPPARGRRNPNLPRYPPPDPLSAEHLRPRVDPPLTDEEFDEYLKDNPQTDEEFIEWLRLKRPRKEGK
jgi:transcriptional regulator with XRE-family HTH domain